MLAGNLGTSGNSMHLRSYGLMDKALDFGTKDCRFESCYDHFWVHNLLGLTSENGFIFNNSVEFEKILFHGSALFTNKITDTNKLGPERRCCLGCQ